MGEAALNGDLDFFLDPTNAIDLEEIGQHMDCHDFRVFQTWLVGEMEFELTSRVFPNADYPECHGPMMSDEFMHYLNEHFDNDTVEVTVTIL